MPTTQIPKSKGNPNIEQSSDSRAILELFEGLGKGAVCQASDGRILSANPSAEGIFGMSLEELRSRTFMDPAWEILWEDGSILPADQHPAALALQSGKPVSDTVLGIRQPETGKQRWFQVAAVPEYRPGEDQPHQACIIFTDITAHREAAQRLNRSRKELQAFYALTELGENQDVTLDELFQRAIDILPNSWQYSEIACGKIVIRGKEFLSANYRESPWNQSAVVLQRGVENGSVEIGYLEERPRADEGPFLKEERMVLNASVERIGRIIERKEINTALRTKKEFLELALQAVSLGTWQQNCLEHRILLDEIACLHFGIRESAASEEPAVVSEQQIMDRIHPDDLPQLVSIYQESILKGEPSTFSAEFRVLDPDGSVRWLAVNVRFKFGWVEDAITLISSVGTTQDTTERKQNEAALRKAIENYRLISEHAEDVIWVMDAETQRFSYVSPSVEKLRGFTPEEVLQQSMREVLGPESADRARDLLTNNYSLFLEGGPMPSAMAELDLTHQNGSLVPT